jgi:type III restriction enzyme
MPDFLIRLSTEPPRHLILETKGFDPLEEVKRAAAERWVAAVNADGTYGHWQYAVAKKVADIGDILGKALPAS